MASITITSIEVGASLGGEHRIYVNYTHSTLTNYELRYKVDAGSWVNINGDDSPDTLVISGFPSDGIAHLFHLDHEGDNVGDTYYFTSPTDDGILVDKAIIESVLVAQYDDLYEFKEGDWTGAAWLNIAKENDDPAITECLMSCRKPIDCNGKENIVMGVFEVDIQIDQAP